jgi:hypothetical protein
MSIDRGTINWSAPEVLRGTSDYTAVGTAAQLLHSSFGLPIALKARLVW